MYVALLCHSLQDYKRQNAILQRYNHLIICLWNLYVYCMHCRTNKPGMFHAFLKFGCTKIRTLHVQYVGITMPK